MTTIAQERAALIKVGRPLRTREQAGYKFKRYAETRSVTEPAPLVFVHITITNPKNYSSDDAHARAIEAIGMARFPNTGISYNRLVFQSGRAQEGQPMGRRGAHTVNDKNLTRCVSPGCPSRGESIPSAATNLNNVVRAYAICQNVNDAVTTAQLDSLAKTIAADMLAGLVRRDADIHGHRCVAYKDCPAGKMWPLMDDLKRLVGKYVTTGFKTTTEPPKELFTVGQYENLMNQIKAEGSETRKEIRRQAIWSQRYEGQTVDDRLRADQAFDTAYDAAKAAGKPEAEALAAGQKAAQAVMQPINDDLEKRAVQNG